MMPVMVVLGLVGCADDTKGSSAQTVESDSGAYVLSVEVDPDPPVVGEVALSVEAPGVSALSMDGGMEGMDHGFTDAPTVTGPEGELWTIEAVFSMSGTWSLTLALDGDSGPDTASMDLEVY